MIDEGLLADHGAVDRAFAIHTTPTVPCGVIATRSGALLASADEFLPDRQGQGRPRLHAP